MLECVVLWQAIIDWCKYYGKDLILDLSYFRIRKNRASGLWSVLLLTQHVGSRNTILIGNFFFSFYSPQLLFHKIIVWREAYGNVYFLNNFKHNQYHQYDEDLRKDNNNMEILLIPLVGRGSIQLTQ